MEKEIIIKVLKDSEKDLADLIMEVVGYGYIPYNCPDEEIDTVRVAGSFIENLCKKLDEEDY